MHSSPMITDRRLERLPATIPISMLLSRETYTTEFDAYTVDVSHKGMRLRTTFTLFPGDIIGVAPGEDASTTVQSRVVWVQHSTLGGSLAGLEFVKSNNLPA